MLNFTTFLASHGIHRTSHFRIDWRVEWEGRKNSAVEFECWQRSMINKSNQLQEFDTMTTRPMTMETQLERGKNVFFLLASAESNRTKRQEKEQKMGKITSKGFINNNNIFCSIIREISYSSHFFVASLNSPASLERSSSSTTAEKGFEFEVKWKKNLYKSFENISSSVIISFFHYFFEKKIWSIRIKCGQKSLAQRSWILKEAFVRSVLRITPSEK